MTDSAPTEPDAPESPEDTPGDARITRWLRRTHGAAFSTYVVFAAFWAYFCMYAFRKPFRAASYEGDAFSVGETTLTLQSLLIIAQVIGYCISKFVGVKVISEQAGKGGRAKWLIGLIVFAELALLGFSVTPHPYSAIFLFLNGLPLGMVWGLVYSYLEGRRVSEILGAGLSASYIIASGAVKDVGTLVLDWGVSPEMMPFVVGALFFPAFLACVWLLSLIPAPSKEDEAARTKRVAMTRPERRAFFRRFWPGLLLLTGLYVFLTAYREFRDAFDVRIWQTLGYGDKPGTLTLSESLIALGVMVALALLFKIRSNRTALLVVHLFMAVGTALIGVSTALYATEAIGGFTWMVSVGFGLYLAYVPFGCVLFDRLIAAVGVAATATFMIYVTDAFGYLGSVGILLFKDFGAPELSWVAFFEALSMFTAVFCTVCYLLAMFYFWRKTRPAIEIGTKPEA